jgi:hypothetical protein
MWIRNEKGDLFNLEHLHAVQLSQRSRFEETWLVVGMIHQSIAPLEVELFKHKAREVAERVMNQIAAYLARTEQLLDLPRQEKEPPRISLAASAG